MQSKFVLWWEAYFESNEEFKPWNGQENEQKGKLNVCE